jgi:hypothetical protein
MYYKIHSVDVGPLLGIVANVDSGDVTILFHNTNEFKFSVCSLIAAPPVALFTYNRSEQQVPLRLLSASTSMVGSCRCGFFFEIVVADVRFCGTDSQGLSRRRYFYGCIVQWQVQRSDLLRHCDGGGSTRRGVGGGVDGLMSNFNFSIHFIFSDDEDADGRRPPFDLQRYRGR